MDGFILPMLAGTVSPSDVTEQVADDVASLADAGILFPADSAGILFPVVPAGIPFLAGPVLTDPGVAQLAPDPTVVDIGNVVDMAVVDEVCPTVPDVFVSRAVVAMVDLLNVLRPLFCALTLG